LRVRLVRTLRSADASHWAHDTPYHRCRFAAEYAFANRVEHPLDISLREDAVIGQVDRWLVREFAPHRLRETISDLAAVQRAESATPADDRREAVLMIAESDRKLAQYRARLDAGANPVTVAAWIVEIEAEKAGYQLVARRAEPKQRRMGKAVIKAIVDRLGDLVRVLADANPNDKSEIFRQLGLELTYHPGRQIVEAQVQRYRHPPCCDDCSQVGISSLNSTMRDWGEPSTERLDSRWQFDNLGNAASHWQLE
jgi:site-specific DNA recombinase